MKRLNVVMVVVLFGYLFTAISCKKHDDNPSRKELLTAKMWRTTSQTISPGIDYNHDGTLENDIFALYADCSKDNLIKFNSDGTITEDAGVLKCNPSDPQTQSNPNERWTMSTDEKQVTIINMEWFGQTNQTVIINITEMSSTMLKCSNTTSIQGTNYTVNMTLAAQ